MNAPSQRCLIIANILYTRRIFHRNHNCFINKTNLKNHLSTEDNSNWVKMSTLEDLHKIQEQQAYTYRNPGRESLLEKYRIPIQHFDFGYVARARDPNELEKILDVLRSGQEGYYPDLMRATENQLRMLRPNSRFLRYSCPVLNKNQLQKDELDHISNDLQKWVTDVNRSSRELETRKTNQIRCDVKVRHQYDPQSQPLNLTKNKPEKRIQATDYRAWDRYDPDTEITKMDLETEKMRKQAEMQQRTAEKSKRDAEKFVYAGTSSQFVMGGLENGQQKQKVKKMVSFNQHSTEAEAVFLSNRELEKGREFFRSGEYEFALRCFTQSVSSKASVINLNNRALTYLKLGKFQEALEDCERVLAIDEKNLKALLRKGQALEGLKKYEEALDCVDLVIEKDPNNAIAQALAERVRKYCRNVLKNTRMKIVEIE